MSENETIADIAAEIREYFDLLKRGLIPDNVARMTTRQRYQFWADRIEAAAKNTENAFGMALAIEDGLHKRESQSAPGNASALREALEVVLDALKKAYATVEVDRVWLADNIDVITDALAATARNADRFTDEDEAVRAYLDEVCSLADNGAPTNEIACNMKMIRWLFATAKKGETNND